jgi:hypothetical protein
MGRTGVGSCLTLTLSQVFFACLRLEAVFAPFAGSRSRRRTHSPTRYFSHTRRIKSYGKTVHFLQEH